MIGDMGCAYLDGGCCRWQEGRSSAQKSVDQPSPRIHVPHARRKQREGPNVEPLQPPPFRRRRRKTNRNISYHTAVELLVLTIALLSRTEAAFINFDNCLAPNIINSSPLQLQFVPQFFNAKFNTTNPSHNLNITIYGNVSGQSTVGPYPGPNDMSWRDPNSTFGKIVDISPSNNKYSTLFSKYQVLTYTPYNAPASEFCQATVNRSCPLVPAFNASGSNPYELPAFTVAHDFYSSYAFGTFAATIRVQSGDAGAPDLACVSANITPDLGMTLSGVLCYLPAAVLILVAIATVFASIYSPWGSSDPFRWTTNYGRDEDLLRLVTPGFGDCLQYIQFVVLTGSLSLNYPGYFQPAVSQTSWAVLMFNESFVSHGNGTQSLVDGVYNTNGTYGLTRLSQLAGMTAVKDIWAGMAIWLLVIVVIVAVLCQLGFVLRWVYRQLTNTQEEDLRRKNWPFTAGNVVRVVFNYFLLPVVALSMFQLVVAPMSPASVVVMAVILLLAIIAFAGWILRLIFTTRPRANLFDDLPTVLLYGPLYNTYSDDAAPFALIPVLLTFIRGVAIGAVQPSGIAQLVMLAICETILILTLHAFRPFQSPTSMNAYHTFFATVRLVTTLLMVAFVPSLGVTEAPKGWLGYAILLLHAIVLVFGFFLNAVQTLIEVAARMAGAGGDERHGAARGGLVKVFGMRQLSRRQQRRGGNRNSMGSDPAILTQDDDSKSIRLMGGRSRSLSASSQILLNQHAGPDQRISGFDQFSQGGVDYLTIDPGTPSGHSHFSYLPDAVGSAGPSSSQRPTLGLKTEPVADPYYRPPRQRRPTMDPYTPGARSRGSWTSGDWANKPYEDSPERTEPKDSGEGPSSPFSPERGAPLPAYLRQHRDDSDPNLVGHDSRRSQTDYAVREVDFYYGVRGPALSNLPTRRLKTGPADPMGPVSSATGWMKKLFGGKSKERGKGFEVVRSSRAPPSGAVLGEELHASPRLHHDPYLDFSDAAGHHGQSSDSKETTDDEGGAKLRRGRTQYSESDYDRPFPNDDDLGLENEGGLYAARVHRISDIPPTLAPIEMTGGIEMPSRVGSRASATLRRNEARGDTNVVTDVGLDFGFNSPTIPRKSSRRTPSMDALHVADGQPRLSMVAASASPLPNRSRLPSPQRQAERGQYLQPSAGSSMRLSPSTSDRDLSDDELRGYQRNAQSLGVVAASERPTSMGYVTQHLASDSIHEGDLEAGTHMGSKAELVDGLRRSVSSGLPYDF
ncbi:hypothetical protein LTR04_006628 [Oleoguttula sp. CCFEE 6159]|nr:hypothetical protein LTR04_006628 [Oleoguttula sp. CCFEE 6159]